MVSFWLLWLSFCRRWLSFWLLWVDRWCRLAVGWRCYGRICRDGRLTSGYLLTHTEIDRHHYSCDNERPNQYPQRLGWLHAAASRAHVAAAGRLGGLPRKGNTNQSDNADDPDDETI